MIDKRLTGLIADSKRYVYLTIFLNWLSLLFHIFFVYTLASAVRVLFTGEREHLTLFLVATVLNLLAKFLTMRLVALTGHKASYQVKMELRDKLFTKLTKLGVSYREKFSTSELLQISMEGVEQLEIYFAQYLPQLFYSMLAPVTLFVALVGVSWPVAVFLLICAPLIPFSIAMVQKFAKKLLGKYWGAYTNLGDHFLENINGLTTLKIYGADQRKSDEMDRDAEHFRKITMKVLSMQLNSIIIMDIIAFGGAAVAMMIALFQFRSGHVDVIGLVAIIFLAAEFFLPLRSLGSLFHVAMNGIAAGGKIFHFLSLEEPEEKTGTIESTAITMSAVKFSYTSEKEVLRGINMYLPENSFSAISGASGCGKSTISGIISGRNKLYEGSVTFGERELADVREEDLLKHVTVVGHNDYIFAGTIRENLLFAAPEATTEEMIAVMRRAELDELLQGDAPLERVLTENAANLSGGQKQRLVLARAILKNSPVYIFDEATSNIDAESENKIMKVIYEMKKKHTVILISHRLHNLIPADNIYFMEGGIIVEEGSHDKLLEKDGAYARMYHEQMNLERYGMEGIQ
ncbi:MAG: ABC transporter ATP-binding protein/permease [Eubacteriales bacterium]|nr:ABC transporter ATP-binding protein/permease [Eubacteriales bacterium]